MTLTTPGHAMEDDPAEDNLNMFNIFGLHV